MNRITLAFIVLIIPWIAEGQNGLTLTLGDCYAKAETASALAGEKDSYRRIWELKDKNLSRAWLPTLDASGNLVYNSEVIDIGNSLGSLPIPGIEDAIKPLPHEQYKVNVDINQVIYDGGAIKGARAIEKADLLINEKQAETDLYKIRSQINTYYFNLLLLDRQEELLNNYLAIVTKRIASMQSGVENGVILRTDIDVMTTEKIKLEQQIRENHIRRESLLRILSGLTATEIDPSSELVMPAFETDTTDVISRPELEIFDLRKDQLDASLQVISSRRMPKAFGFATLGYGNPPGNNFFRDEFAPYYILGAGIKWNIFDWNKAKTEKQIIGLQHVIIENRQTDLTDNLSRMLEAKKAEISSLSALLETDLELISLRKRITVSAESQYENGTITATDLLNEITAEKQVLINHEIHRINLAMAQADYYNISGKETE
ncbi:MAG: TolC family protein [Bacteroidales bacterium]|jgi:outer membrane protein TolC|nr:TolC family protein [Bacteroidales bacterium]